MSISKIKIATLSTLLFFSLPVGAQAEINVVTTIRPLHSIVSTIMQGVGTPKLLMRTTVSPHDFTLKPSNIRTLNQADIIFWIGPSLESRLAKSIRNAGTSVQVVELMKSPKIKTLEIRGTDGAHDHNHGHNHDAADPHIWLNTQNAIAIASSVRSAMSKLDSTKAEIYSKNFNKFAARMTQIQANIRSKLKTVLKERFITYHDSVHYFEQEFGLDGHGAITPSSEHRPGAKRISDLRKMIEAKKITCIFSQPYYNQKILHSIAKGSQTKIASLDTIGHSIKPGSDLYENLVLKISNSIHDCLSPTN
jgi:zinc transport system substrate-binding protein